MAPTMNYDGQMAIDTAAPFDTSSIPLEFISENLAKTGTILDSSGIRGVRGHNSERTRTGGYTVSGSITFHCSRILLDNLLPMILGAAESSNVFDVADTLAERLIMIDRGAKVFTYAGVKCNRATFRAQEQGFLELTLDVEAETETVGAAGSFPSLTMPTEKPYVFTDSVLTLQSSTREIKSFELIIDNALDTARFHNSLTRSEIPATDRIVTLRTTHPYTSAETDLYDQALAGATDAAMVFTNAEVTDDVLTFDLGTVQYPSQSPVTPNRNGERVLELEGIARSVGSAADIQVTNAHTA